MMNEQWNAGTLKAKFPYKKHLREFRHILEQVCIKSDLVTGERAFEVEYQKFLASVQSAISQELGLSGKSPV